MLDDNCCTIEPPDLNDSEHRVDRFAVNPRRRKIDFDCQVRTGIIARVLGVAVERIPRNPQFLGVEVIGKVGLQAPLRVLGIPGRLARFFAVDVQGQRHHGDDLADQLLVPLVKVSGGHELQVLPIVSQAHVLALADRPGKALINVPADTPNGDPLITLHRVGSTRRRRHGQGSRTSRNRGHRIAPSFDARAS